MPCQPGSHIRTKHRLFISWWRDQHPLVNIKMLEPGPCILPPNAGQTFFSSSRPTQTLEVCGRIDYCFTKWILVLLDVMMKLYFMRTILYLMFAVCGWKIIKRLMVVLVSWTLLCRSNLSDSTLCAFCIFFDDALTCAIWKKTVVLLVYNTTIVGGEADVIITFIIVTISIVFSGIYSRILVWF